MNKKREYRNMPFFAKKRDSEGGTEFLVEGYASTFDEYIVCSFDGIDYKERIEPTAFDNCDMSDVVFRIDHEGPVYARTKAGTIKLNIDTKGLHQITDLSRTTNSRNIYEDIDAGNYPQMSFAFTVKEDAYNSETHTRIIKQIEKLYDISPVSFPANPNTNLSARDYFNGVIEMEKAERLEAQRKEKETTELRVWRDTLKKEIIKEMVRSEI